MIHDYRYNYFLYSVAVYFYVMSKVRYGNVFELNNLNISNYKN